MGDSLQSKNNDLTTKLENSEVHRTELKALVDEFQKKAIELADKNEIVRKEKSSLSKNLEDQKFLVSSQKSALLQMAEDHKLVINQSVQTINEMKVRHQEDQNEKNNFMSLIEGKTSAINSLKEEIV